MSRPSWEADKMLDVYIYDYLVKRNLHSTAITFLAERRLPMHPVAIDAPGGFLLEWWSVFWDTFISRTNERRLDDAASCTEVQLQHHQPLLQSSYPSSQVLLQQQHMLQSQPTTFPFVNDLERKSKLLNKQNLDFGTRQINIMGDLPTNAQLTARIGYPVLPHGNVDLLLKHQEYMQHSLLGQCYQNNKFSLELQDVMLASGGRIGGGGLSSAFKGIVEASPKKTGQKRKSQDSASFPANHFRNVKVSKLPPRTLSRLSTGPLEAMTSTGFLPQNDCFSSSLLRIGSDVVGPVSSVTSQLPHTNVVLDDASFPTYMESSSHEDTVNGGRVDQHGFVSKGMTLSEMRCLAASSSNIECCHFSSDGKLLAAVGQDKKVTIWCTESFISKSTFEEHSQLITDIRFSARMPRLSTSSADKTVRIWDANDPGNSLRTFTGHSCGVTSLDFHPWKDDLVCSCDNNTEIRYWSIKSGRCVGVIKGDASHVRFQPCAGRFLAAATKNIFSIIDVETQQVSQNKMQGHKYSVHTVCWDSTGEYLASVSEDLVKVWRISSVGKSECVHELASVENKFKACVFHPTDPSIVIIGCSERLELWNIAENKKVTVPAHDKPISCLAASKANALIASTSQGGFIKIWK